MHMRKLGTSAAALALSAAMLAGCSSAGAQSAADSGASEAVAVQQAAASDTRTVVDSNGKQVEIPREVTKVAPTMGAFAQVTEMLTQGNGKIAAASTKQVSDAFKAVFADYNQSNPNGYDSSSVEDIIASGTQVVYGPSSMYSDEQLAQLQAAGVAVVALDNIGTVDGMCESILTIGEILGEDELEVAQGFVDYYRQSLEDARARTSGLADADRKTVVQLNMAGDAYTCADGTDISSAYYEAAGAVNVAKDFEGVQNGQYRTVDAEQLVSWDPEYIVVMNTAVKDAVLSDAALANVTAVRNGDVYVCPTALYLWCVRSAEGALMTPWLGTVIYPDEFSDVNMVQVLQDFYAVYYASDLSAADAEAILSGATSAPMGGQGGGRS